MATNPTNLAENAGRVTAADANYPYSSAKDDTTGASGDGTPIKKAWMNDIYGFQQWLLDQAGIVPSGNAETVLASDFGDALEALFAVLTDFDNLTTTTTEGYQELPGGVIIQWGMATLAAVPGVVTYPLAFPTKVLFSMASDATGIDEIVGVVLAGIADMTVTTASGSAPGDVSWLVIGH